MGNMRFKVGDRVRIKSLDWYKENMDEYGRINCGYAQFIPDMSTYCGEILTICDIEEDFSYYHMKECLYVFMDEMIEGLVEEEITNIMDEDKRLIGWIKEPNRYRLVPDKDYEIKYDERGFFYLEKKKKEYPKTYEECCKIMQVARPTIWFDYDDVSSISKEGDEYECHIENTLCAFRKLLICRDAYLKLYGEEMGLGKPWEPDWNDEKQDKYGFYNEVKYTIINPTIFVFPTSEMRDAFKENFDKDIEICKELL